ncbi:MAG: M23 family metallopeptidase [Ignavibacteriales bacterium]|nr:M23 family metallopeptidase [Ignavibacteriales bacterium]
MALENVRERKQKRRYTFVVVPDVKSEKTRTFSITRLGLIGLIISILIVFIAVMLAIIIYTPIGGQLPISQSAIAKKYNRQMVDVQNQLKSLVQEMTIIRSYNIRLRNVLGEKITIEDSLRMVNSATDSMALAARFKVEPEEKSSPEPIEQQSAVPINQQISGSELIPTRQMLNSNFTNQLPLILPVNGYLARGFEPQQFHYGIDLAGRARMPVVSAANGSVIFSNWTTEDGYVIMIVHDGGYITVYKHNFSLLKNIGERVRRGEPIALLGNTGERSHGPHLHFELWINGVVQDPANYLLNTN